MKAYLLSPDHPQLIHIYFIGDQAYFLFNIFLHFDQVVDFVYSMDYRRVVTAAKYFPDHGEAGV